jgi:hypothetical protein
MAGEPCNPGGVASQAEDHDEPHGALSAPHPDGRKNIAAKISYAFMERSHGCVKGAVRSGRRRWA